jgi:molybdate transport system substrate-binding protein
LAASLLQITPGAHNPAMTATLQGISSMATRQLLAELVPAYRERTGRPVAVESVGGVDAARRVAAGEPFDFVVLASDAIDKLFSSGHALAGSRIDVAVSEVAVAVKSGAARPDISSEQALMRTVLAAGTVGYSTGPSGVALVKLFERWGIAQELQGRLVQAPPGVPVGALVARGDVALGFQQLSEMIHLEGITVLGPMPQPVQIATTFAAAVCAASRQPDAARELLAFLASPEAAGAKHRNGMDAA